MVLDLNTLENIVKKVFSNMRSRGIREITLDSDFYWDIPTELLYDPYNEPKELNIGQLEEDYDVLKQSSQKNILVGHNLKNISVLLRYISMKHPL